MNYIDMKIMTSGAVREHADVTLGDEAFARLAAGLYVKGRAERKLEKLSCVPPVVFVPTNYGSATQWALVREDIFNLAVQEACCARETLLNTLLADNAKLKEDLSALYAANVPIQESNSGDFSETGERDERGIFSGSGGGDPVAEVI